MFDRTNPAWDVDVIEVDFLTGRKRYMYDKTRRRLYIPRGQFPVLAARFEARYIVRDGILAAHPWIRL